MALQINIRHLEEKDLELKGEMPVSELDLGVEDDLIKPRSALSYNVTVSKMGGQILVRGRIKLILDCMCARCLKPFEDAIKLADWICYLPLEGPEKVVVNNDCVDLTPYIREDILLEFPQHPLCEADCGGLPNRENKDKESKAGQVMPDWSVLNKLKF